MIKYNMIINYDSYSGYSGISGSVVTYPPPYGRSHFPPKKRYSFPPINNE